MKSPIQKDGSVDLDYVWADMDDFDACARDSSNPRSVIRMITAVGYLDRLLREARVNRAIVLAAKAYSSELGPLHSTKCLPLPEGPCVCICGAYALRDSLTAREAFLKKELE